jgi:hypothetical protein
LPNGAEYLYCFYFGILLMLKERVKSLLFQRRVQRMTPLYGCLWRRHRDSLKLNSSGCVQGYGCDYRGISFRREKRAVFSCFAWNAYTTNGGIVKALSSLEIEKSVYGDYTRTLGLALRILTAAFRNWVSVRTKGCGSLTPVALWLLDGCTQLEDYIVFDWFFPYCDTF